METIQAVHMIITSVVSLATVVIGGYAGIKKMMVEKENKKTSECQSFRDRLIVLETKMAAEKDQLDYMLNKLDELIKEMRE